jgi:hypothetical protein
MAFWSNAGPEPKRQYRWYIDFGGPGSAAGTQAANLDGLRYALKKVDKPKAKIGSIQHKYLNHFFNYPGRLEWEDINITFASIAQPDATYILNKVLGESGYQLPDTVANGTFPVKTISKSAATKQLGNSIDIVQINASGGIIEKWSLYNPFFINVQFGSLDYSNEEIVEIQCTMKYDWAKLDPLNGSAGYDTDEGGTGLI